MSEPETELEISAFADDHPSFVVGFLGARVDHTCDHPSEIVDARLDEIERRILEIEAARPTPEIGEDELVERLRELAETAPDPRPMSAVMIEAADRLILYREALADPTAVHLNMLRGGIAKPSVPNIWHLYGEEALMQLYPVNGGSGAI